MTRIKICGITNIDDARAAVDAGADAIGLVFAESPRQVDVQTARPIISAVPPFVSVIGVFMNQDIGFVFETANSLRLDAVQLHGDESPADCAKLPCKIIKRFDIPAGVTAVDLAARIDEYNVAAHLLDPGAGGGRTFDWTLARDLHRTVIISGGLTPENVADAVRTARPFAVDTASGVEASPGRKDHDKLRAFVRAVRNADG